MTGIMGMFIANKAIFIHVHKLTDGTTIVHAHPYDKSNDSRPFKSHHHSKAEFLIYQNFETLFLLCFLTLILVELIRKEKVIFELKTNHSLFLINLQKGRAPPIL